MAFDYLVEPGNRPEWQSSLRRVEHVSGTTPEVGQAWVDVTTVGARPAMETVRLDRPRTWAERGTWRALAATLTLEFLPVGERCRVHATFEVTGRGPVRPLGMVLTRLAPGAVRADLRRAARILSERATGH